MFKINDIVFDKENNHFSKVISARSPLRLQELGNPYHPHYIQFIKNCDKIKITKLEKIIYGI